MVVVGTAAFEPKCSIVDVSGRSGLVRGKNIDSEALVGETSSYMDWADFHKEEAPDEMLAQPDAAVEPTPVSLN